SSLDLLALELRERTARELMREPAVIKSTDNLHDAFVLIHRSDAGGLPVVDEEGRAVGYLDFLMIAPLWLEERAK
ncbi:unnamed protein product, partial [marine sediment metagenome]